MKNKIALIVISLIVLTMLASCGASDAVASTIIQMEVTKDYDTSDPFINERIIYVSEDTGPLELAITFEMKGESGQLQIADNETQHVFWSQEWNEDVDKTELIVPLDQLEKDRDYVIRFTGIKIEYAKVVVASENKLVREREKPVKPSKTPANEVDGGQTGTPSASASATDTIGLEYEDITAGFSPVQPVDIEPMLQQGQKFVLYVGRKSCPYCVEFAPALKKAADERNIEVYYMDSIDIYEKSPQAVKDFRDKYSIDTVPSLLIFEGDSEPMMYDDEDYTSYEAVLGFLDDGIK